MSTRQGRIVALSVPEYNAAPGVRLSHLKLMDKSELDYRENVRKWSSVLDLGAAIHMAVLEPLKFDDHFAVFDGDRRKKEWKLFKAEHEGEDILVREDYDACVSISKAVYGHTQASQYFTAASAAFEVSILWRHPLGIECKSRNDLLSDTHLVDLKSTKDVTARKFGYQCADLHYYAQMAFYHDAAKSVDGRDRKVVLLALEKVPPWNVVPYVLSRADLAAGRHKYQDWLMMLTRCLASGEWRGVGEGEEVPLQMPERVFSEWDDATIVMPDGEVVAI